LDVARNALQQPSATAWAHLQEASALANLGRIDEAETAMQRAIALQPEVSLRWLRTLLPALPYAKLDDYLDGLRKAGLPE
jgi:tetratricopeptide (TPR) repeat protein